MGSRFVCLADQFEVFIARPLPLRNFIRREKYFSHFIPVCSIHSCFGVGMGIVQLEVPTLFVEMEMLSDGKSLEKLLYSKLIVIIQKHAGLTHDITRRVVELTNNCSRFIESRVTSVQSKSSEN